jgi:hypothetical protein
VSADPAGPGWLQRPAGTAAVAAFFLVMATLFTWPAARLDPGTLVTRHFDLYVSIWLMEQAVDGFPRLLAAGAGWPSGESLARADSMLMLALAWAGRGLLSGWLLASLFTWLGPALNAIAAEHCARRVLAVQRPWSLLAGLAFGFSGIAALAVLEGHVYFLLAFWLPLMITTAWTGPEEGLPWARGLLLGGLWAMALLSSAYLGIPATLLLGVLVVARPRRVLRLLPTAAVVALPVATWYLWVFSHGAAGPDQPKPELILAVGTATVANLTTWSAHLDAVGHSLGAPLAFTSLVLLGFAPLLLRHHGGWRALALLAVAALLLCFGRTFQLTAGGPSLPSPAALLVHLPGVEVFRFPIRFAWLYTLCGGLVAAAALQALARRLPPWAVAPVLLLAAGEALVGTGLPWRVDRAIAAAPSAYDAAPADLAVLDLYGRSLDGTDSELEMWTRSLGCYYQAQHGRPVLELCVDTEVDSPRERLEAQLGSLLLGPQASREAVSGAARELAHRGVGAVVLHHDFLRSADAQALHAGLTAMLGPAAASSTDGGERVSLFLVPDAQRPPGAHP